MDRMMWTMMTIAGCLLVGVAYMGIQEGQEWKSFVVAHQCHIVTHINGTVFNTLGIDAKGNTTVGIGSTPDKTGYLCDDGITYFR